MGDTPMSLFPSAVSSILRLNTAFTFCFYNKFKANKFILKESKNNWTLNEEPLDCE